MRRRIDPELTSKARYLRSNATDCERMLWQRLSQYRPRFARQLSIPPYIDDFACRQAKLAIEIDGGQHADSFRDEARTRFLVAQGWTVIRFWNSDVIDNIDGVTEAILPKAAECLGGTRP